MFCVGAIFVPLPVSFGYPDNYLLVTHLTDNI